MTALGFQKLRWVWMQSSRSNVDLAGVVGRGATEADNEVASSRDNFRDIEDRREIGDDERTSSDRSAAAPASKERHRLSHRSLVVAFDELQLHFDPVAR